MKAGITYYYWVKARNNAGGSRFSASDHGYAGPLVVPPAPVDVATTKGAFTDRVRVSWDTVSSSAFYDIYRGTNHPSGSAVKVGEDDHSPFDDPTAIISMPYLLLDQGEK